MGTYAKALTALLLGIAQAAALLPSDAPRWLLVVGVAVQTLAVWAVPNKPEPTVAAHR